MVNGISIPASLILHRKGVAVEFSTSLIDFHETGKASILSFKKWRVANPELKAVIYNQSHRIIDTAKDATGEGGTGKVSFVPVHTKDGKPSEYQSYSKARVTWNDTSFISQLLVKIRIARDASIMAMPIEKVMLLTSGLDHKFIARVMLANCGLVGDPILSTIDILKAHLSIHRIAVTLSLESALKAMAKAIAKEEKERVERKAAREKAKKEALDKLEASRVSTKMGRCKAVSPKSVKSEEKAPSPEENANAMQEVKEAQASLDTRILSNVKKGKGEKVA